nr:cytochrome P450 [Actinoalloteichus spitiensis]
MSPAEHRACGAPHPPDPSGRTPVFTLNEVPALESDPLFALFRRDRPLSRIRLPHGGEGWLVTRYQDVRTVMTHPAFSAAAAASDRVPRMTVVAGRPAETIAGLDPPEHTRLRRLAAPTFRASRIATFRPLATRIAVDTLDELTRSGRPADFVRHFALPFPVRLICTVLGVPYEDHSRFVPWSESVLSTSGLSGAESAQALEEMKEYFRHLIAARRRAPHDDLLADLVAARDSAPEPGEADQLSEEELVMFAVLLLIAGYETSINQIGASCFLLLEERSRWEQLVANPRLVTRAVEELLRFVPLINGVTLPRVAVSDVEIAGGTIRAGEAVFVSIPSANRDERVFDDPDTFDLTRVHNQHVAFGHGPHYCLGAHLARLELQVALAELVRALPSLRLATPRDDVPWRTGLVARGPTALPVSW